MLDMPTYDPIAVQPMRDELTQVGFSEALTIDQLTENISAKGTCLVVVNSVCGCSAGSARPGVCAALQNPLIPDRLLTAFAGQEKSVIKHLRENYLSQYAPSSPNIILFKDGKLELFLERTDIQELSPQEIDIQLSSIFSKLCTRNGPSISPEAYEQLEHTISCGSKIPRVDGSPRSC